MTEGHQTPPLDERSRTLRRMILSTLVKAGRGHAGPALSLVEILRVLYDDILRFDPANPRWPERDRCILSKGHGCLALYAILADKGFFPASALETFCRADSFLGGHPERDHVPGVEASTGALGHGLSIGVGMALANRISGRRSRVVVICGDGEMNEGSVWEAALSAAKHRLDTLTLIVDYNKMQSYGPVEVVLPLEPLARKLEAFGFDTVEVDGHDVRALRGALARDRRGLPAAVICHTVKGKGLSFAENNAEWHHKNKITAEERASIAAEIGGLQP